MKEVKPRKLSRKKLIEEAIAELEKETGFHIINVRFGDGYLVDTTKNGVCWFNVKELPGYRFAFWHKDMYNPQGFGPEYLYSELIMFTQHELTLDKFKPGRSSFRTPLHRYMEKPNNSKEWKESWYNYGAVDIMKFIKAHKYKAFFIQSYDDWDPWDYVSGPVAFKEYYRTRFMNWKYDISKKIKIKRISNDIMCKFNNVGGLRIILADYGECCSPRLHLFIYENKRAPRDKVLINDIISYIEDKYWNDISIFYVEKSEKFKSILKQRQERDGKDEKLIWTKI